MNAAWAGLVLAAASAATPSVVGAAPQHTALVCEAVYTPAREIWVRTVQIGYDDRRISDLRIDNVPVYSFSVEGNVIRTALDNERIQIDVAAQAWQSDFRGQATSQGRCERAR